MRVAVGMMVLASMVGAAAQEPGRPAEQTSAPQEKKTEAGTKATAVTAGARLASARTVFVKKGRGSEIPFNVISSGLEGWGKYSLVGSPEKADLVVEITAPDDSGSGVSISSSTSRDSYGKEERSTKTTRDLSSGTMVVMTVYDARNNVPLWRASEQAKSAMKQKARQDNMVEAAQKILGKFRDRVEPIR